MESAIVNVSADKIADTRVGASLALYTFALAIREAFPNKEFIDCEMICIKKAVIINRLVLHKGQMNQIYAEWQEYIKQNDYEYFQKESEKDKKGAKSGFIAAIILIVIAVLVIFLGPKIIGWLLF